MSEGSLPCVGLATFQICSRLIRLLPCVGLGWLRFQPSASTVDPSCAALRPIAGMSTLCMAAK
jgi:hypothetical protein